MTQPATGTRQIPAQAFRFIDAHRFQFAEQKDGQTGIYPFSMIARSAEPVEHYYWGRIVHDLSGMVLRKSSVTVDYAHDFDAVIGFADKFSVTENGLEVSGALVSTEPNDKADEVYKKGRAGVPYEASIDWEGLDSELEYIPDGVTTEVNGKQFAGPGYVVRRWPLRAMAVCRYGVDPDSRTQFARSDKPSGGTVSVRVFSNSGEVKMADGQVPQPETQVPEHDGKPTATTSAPSVDATGTSQQFATGVITIDTLKQFSAEFGPQGPDYLAQGLTLDAARYQFALHQRDEALAQAKQFREQAEAEAKKVADLSQKLRQFGADLGQDTPVSTDGDGKDGTVDPRLKQFSDNDPRARFAASIKLPSKK